MDIIERNLKSGIMLARLAMAIDCEGSISIMKQPDKRRKSGYRYYTVLHIYNTDERLIDWIRDNFGFKKYRGSRQRNPKHKQEYYAVSTRRKLEPILRKIMPYLIIKGKLAILALELQKTMGQPYRPVQDEMLEYREQLWLQAKELNRRGRP